MQTGSDEIRPDSANARSSSPLPAIDALGVRIGSIAPVRLRVKRVRGTSVSGPAGRASAHPRLGRLRRIDDVGDGSASRSVATTMALSLLKILAFPSEAPSEGWNAMAKYLNPTNHMRPTEGGAFTLPSVGQLASIPCRTVRRTKTRKHAPSCEIVKL
jgi:hypothetical protein